MLLFTTGIYTIVGQLLIAFLVWRHYRDLSLPAEYRYRTFIPRFWTFGVDVCVMIPFSFALAIGSPFFRNFGAFILASVIRQLVWWAYLIAMHAKFGQTVGKGVCQIRVVDAVTEGPITWRQALLRESVPIALILFLAILIWSAGPAEADGGWPWVLLLFATLPGLWQVLEIVTMLTNEKGRALHDYIAGTVVVRTNAEEVIQITAPEGLTNQH